MGTDGHWSHISFRETDMQRPRPFKSCWQMQKPRPHTGTDKFWGHTFFAVTERCRGHTLFTVTNRYRGHAFCWQMQRPHFFETDWHTETAPLSPKLTVTEGRLSSKWLTDQRPRSPSFRETAREKLTVPKEIHLRMFLNNNKKAKIAAHMILNWHRHAYWQEYHCTLLCVSFTFLRCGLMLPLRFSSPMDLASGLWSRLGATTPSTTTFTSMEQLHDLTTGIQLRPMCFQWKKRIFLYKAV